MTPTLHTFEITITGRASPNSRPVTKTLFGQLELDTGEALSTLLSRPIREAKAEAGLPYADGVRILLTGAFL